MMADGRVSWPGGDGFDLKQHFGRSQAGGPDQGLRGRVGAPAALHGLRDRRELVEVVVHDIRPEMDDMAEVTGDVAAWLDSVRVETQSAQSTGSTIDALGRWDDNRNGRITCAEAHRHGIAPVTRGHPAYRYIRDGDRDGVVCE